MRRKQPTAVSIFDDQISIAIEPFHAVIKDGDIRLFYDLMPTIICYLGWNDYPNLVKAYPFNLLCLQHWKVNRTDCLLLL